ncbi:MAG: GAF domain-containing protein [Candidatus Eremiobacteraeota bacterium]|nr:GAF domain-containing protein [Candidatus Eremiobacteraeota bacterium]
MDEENLDISRINQLMDQSTQTLESPDEILEDCLKNIVEAIDAERGFIMLYDSNFDELNVFAACNIDPDTLFTTAEVSQTVINNVYEEEKSVMSSNALDDPRFSEKSSVVISGLRSIACVPILIESGLVGLIYVDNRLRIGAYEQKHLQFLETCTRKLAEVILKVFPETQAKPRK